MPLPETAALITVKGYWWNVDGDGVDRVVTATPAVSHVTSLSGYGVIDLEAVTATPDADGFWQLPLIASDDPDLTPACPWTFTFAGYGAGWSVTVPHDAAGGAVWLTALDHLVSPPSSAAAFYTRDQVDALFTAQDEDIEALEARVAELEGLDPQV